VYQSLLEVVRQLVQVMATRSNPRGMCKLKKKVEGIPGWLKISTLELLRCLAQETDALPQYTYVHSHNTN
jgi:hypothetical protein